MITGHYSNPSGVLYSYTAKYAAGTGNLIWEHINAGPGGYEVPAEVAVDASGNVVVTGYSRNAGGPSADKAYYTARHAAADGALVWERRYDGPFGGDDQAKGLAIDASGNVGVTGFCTTATGKSAYTAKYAAADGSILWGIHHQPAGNATSIGFDIAFDAAGNALATGQTLNAVTYLDGYVAKFAAADGALAWETIVDDQAGAYHRMTGIVEDGSGNAIVIGEVDEPGDGLEFYLAKCSGTDGAVVWAKQTHLTAQGLGGQALALGADGSIAVAGTSYVSVTSGPIYAHTFKYIPDSVTLAPTLTSPAASSTTTEGQVAVQFTLPEAALPGSVQLNFSDGFSARRMVLAASQESAGVHSFTFDQTSPYGAFITGDMGGGTTIGGIPDGTYGVEISYQDGAGNARAYATNPAVLLQSSAATLTPALVQPTAGLHVGLVMYVQFWLPEAALAGSVKLTFNDGGTPRVLTLAGTWASQTLHTLNFSVANPLASAQIASMTPGSSLPDGTYSVRVSYQDALGNAVAESPASTGVVIDTVAQPPTLHSPVSTASSSPITVSFTLPEAANVVSLSFAGPVNRVFYLAASQRSAGMHTFTFNTANPAAAAQIESGGADLPDGIYSANLHYQDLSNNSASAFSGPTFPSFRIDTVAPSPGFLTPSASSVTAGGSLDLTATVFTDNIAVTSYEFFVNNVPVAAPGLSSLITITAPATVGVQTAKVRARDAAGNFAEAFTSFDTTPPDPVLTTIFSKASAVPGAGVDPRIPAGAVWTTFGVPAINDDGDVALVGSWSGSGTGSAVFGTSPTTGELEIIIKRTLPAPGAGTGTMPTGAVMSAFKDPLLAEDGAVVVIATLGNAAGQTGITTANNMAIFLDADGAGLGAAVLVAHKGAVASGVAGSQWKAFTSVALGERALAFTGTMVTGLLGAPGPGGVTSATDTGLWIYDRAGSTMMLALREGSALLGSTVKTIAAFVARAGSAGQGRGVEGAATGQVVVRVALADGRGAVGTVDESGAVSFPYVKDGSATAYNATAPPLWLGFGLPTQNSAGALAFTGTVKTAMGGPTTANNVALYAEDDTNYEAARLVTKGDAAPGVTYGKFAAFQDPVSALNRSIAFRGTLTNDTVAGISVGNYHGIWWRDGAGVLKLVARKGYEAAEAAPAASIPVGVGPLPKWNGFTSLALPEGATGPLFVASLLNSTPVPVGSPKLPGPGGVTTATDVGLWAVDSAGALRLLLREGGTYGGVAVKNFTVLTAVSGSMGQTRGYNNNAEVIVRVTDTANAQHVMKITVP